MARNILMLHQWLWLVLELAIVVFAVVAAWRHKRIGLWFLGAGVILGVLGDLLHMLWSNGFLMRGEDRTVYLIVVGYGYYATMIAAVCGWCILAFSRSHWENRDAEPGAAPNSGPAAPVGNSGVSEGPPSVS